MQADQQEHCNTGAGKQRPSESRFWSFKLTATPGSKSFHDSTVLHRFMSETKAYGNRKYTRNKPETH